MHFKERTADMDYTEHLAQRLRARIQETYGADVEGLSEWLETPPDPKMGDHAFPCFRLSRQLRMAPPKIAQMLGEGFAPDAYIQRTECVGGYLNFFLNKGGYAEEVLGNIQRMGDRYGSGEEGKGKTICIDYSSINIAKRFHIGHLSTTMIGSALYKMYSYLGYTCVGINHLGDWGTQFGKMIAAYIHWGDREQVEKGGVAALSELYVRFHKETEDGKNPTLEAEGHEWFRKIEEGDEQALSIFSWFKELTLKEAERVYDMLGVKFDSYLGESFYFDKTGPVVEELKAKGLLKQSQGAYVVDLEPYKMPPCIILKSDGTTIYATRDIAAAFYRKATYNFDKCLYVVAYQQNLHFRQWFKVVELMGYPWAKDLEHVAFGMVSYEGQSLSTRSGHVLILEELLERAVEKAREIIEVKSPQLENKDEIAKQVGIGAVIFFDLFNSRIKDIDFYWDRALNFDGETGPYVQYTHARCCSVLRKAGGAPEGQIDGSLLQDPLAQALLRALDELPAVIREAVKRNEPYLVTRHCVQMAQCYNRYYYENQILAEEEDVRRARLALTDAARRCIRIGLNLLGIQAPEKM